MPEWMSLTLGKGSRFTRDFLLPVVGLWAVVAVYVLVIRPRFDTSPIRLTVWIAPILYTAGCAFRWARGR